MPAQPSLFDSLPQASERIVSAIARLSLRAGDRVRLVRSASRHRRDIERLLPVARYLAARAGSAGVTVADLREEAVARGILTGEEAGRVLSYLGVVMKCAGLINTHQYRRSHIDRSNGNLHAIWRAPCPTAAS